MKQSPAIAIVGMACRYPDAGSPDELWENVLAQRRAFRRIPAERLNTDDYWSADRSMADRTYSNQAAVIEGYTFDRVRFRVSGDTFRATDLAHWLSLDVAAQALSDAGFPDGEGLPRASTGVVLGNTLTGEFSRAHQMRLRWPYVRRVLDDALAREGWSPEQRRPFLDNLAARYKAPFPHVGTETLAGGLSNTIAGRVCNYFDLKGGGFTVDGACASSLLAVINACTALASGDLEYALAGGVDLSLDPFELVGFAKVGALAAERMRVYDARSNGFWPGEGCGFVVLMRHEDALRQGRRIYAVIQGWGVSSDGSGGITRPEVEGQLLALRRAYRRAAFGIETVALFEGHGTGTSVGDAVELRMLSRLRREASTSSPPAVIGSVKANIGHTKAAAGIAGLIKATLALHHQMLPPTTGCETPHPELTGEAPALRILKGGEPWEEHASLRAGVSAMGFGGINTHVVLESTAPRRPTAFDHQERILLTSAQDAELFLLGAPDTAGLRTRVEHLLTFSSKLSLSELTDLAAHFAATLDDRTVRAAVVASTPSELTKRLKNLKVWLEKETTVRLDKGVYLSSSSRLPRIGFLFPGQGSPAHLDGGALIRRFPSIRTLYEEINLPGQGDGIATDVAQPAIVAATIAGLHVLDHMGVTASLAVGHSLGELTALHWAGAFDRQTLLEIARVRGRAMAELGNPSGAMAGIGAGPKIVETLIEDEPVVIAGLNGPRQTVIAGDKNAITSVIERARANGLSAYSLAVSHAFHSPLVASAVEPLAAYLERCETHPLQHKVVSTITGKPLASNEDLAALLREQVTSPVRFTEAIRAAQELDLWIEVGPGRILTRLVSGFTQTPVMATDAAGPSLNGLLQAVGAAYVLGAPVRADALFEERFARPFDLNWQPQFFVNPCELAPASDPATNAPRPTIESIPVGANGTAPPLPSWMQDATVADQQSILDSIRHLVAERAELPTDAVRGEDRLLSDLHLNSITVSELLIELAGQLNLSPSVIPTNYADETLAEVAESFEDCILAGSPGRTEEKASQLPGLDAWIRPFTVALVEQERPHARRSTPPGTWRIFAPSGYPLKTALLEAFEGNAAGSGVIVALPPTPDEEHIPLLLDGVRTAISEERPDHFVLVQHGGGAASLARTLHLEVPGVTVCVVDIPIDHPDAVAWVLAEVQATTGYTEAHFDAAGTRREPRLRLLPSDERPGSLPIGRDDVLLVTGGGKGITAECALEIGRETNARLILLGRSQPPENAELAAVLKRMDDAGIRFRYVATDLTDAAAVRAVIKEVETQYGPVTGILHGAARNVPRRLRSLDETDFQETLAPKVQGLRHVLAAVDPEHLRLLVTFGSIIARMGLPSEADYALANEWLVRLTEDWQREHPHCQCLAIEWSVWSDVGMGARLGSLDALTAQGVIPIPPEKGIALLRDLLSRSLPDTAVVVTGRFGNPPTLKIEQPELPFLRFLEQPRIYYPGVELVAEAHLSIDTDPYLDDHVLQGERLLPAVIGLEAMAQAAMGLTGEARIPTFEDVSFNRPIVVPNDEGITLRVTALVRAPGKVDVALRCESTAFQVDHFRATCCFNTTRSPERSNHEIEHHTEPVSLDPEHALYDGILFQSGRFKRLGGYRMLRAKACLAELTQDTSTAWFGRYLPPDLVLGDPGARDAAIHAIQACIPHATLIPVAVDQVIFEEEQPSGRQFVHARERMREGTTFVYDMERLDADGRVLERWEGLRMQRVGHEVQSHSWAAPLLGPYMERRIQEWMPESDATLVVTQQAIKESTPSDQAIRLALGFASPGLWQRNGEQGNKEEPRVFVSQSNSLMLAAQGSGLLGCAMDPVRTRPETPWPDRLGPALYKLALRISERSGEDAETAVTRVWAARECLKKAGVWSETEPLTLDAFRDADWVFFIGRDVTVLSYHTTIQGCSETMVLTLLVRSSLRSPLAQKATEREGTPRDPGSNGSSN